VTTGPLNGAPSLIALTGAPAGAADWYFETLDGDGGTNGRTTNDVGLDNAVTLYGGVPHVWYHDATARTLRQAWYS